MSSGAVNLVSSVANPRPTPQQSEAILRRARIQGFVSLNSRLESDKEEEEFQTLSFFFFFFFLSLGDASSSSASPASPPFAFC